MKYQRSVLAIIAALQTASAFQVVVPVNARNNVNRVGSSRISSSTSLYGKLWDKLGIEPDTMEDEPGWYVMNCVAGSEMDLLAQAKHVTKDHPPELIEKLSVPTERHLRSHGKSQKVVEVRVMYPGYCFVKMRCCAETYEPLQELPLCRSWMAGTVNQKGYKKLPPAPICLSDEEVSKFIGLEEATEEMYQKFGEDYTGRGDSGEDLLAQYEGYEVDGMVKILSGNFKGEDGVVKRLKNGQIMVRLFTYGNVNDQWFDVKEIRPMTDAEAMKGLSGPPKPVDQDEFDISIGKKPKQRENGRTMRKDLYDSARGGGGGDRNRRQDRISRGETGGKDIFGRTEQEASEEEQNWRQFREERRAEQQQKRGDMWGIKERTSWDAGDDAASMGSDGKWKSGREERKERKKREAQTVADAVSGDGDWDLFSSDAQVGSGSGEEDDFFNSLMSELSDNLDAPSPSSAPAPVSASAPAPASAAKSETADDDFFASLMDELSDSMDSDSDEKEQAPLKPKTKPSETFEEDDFFASLEADLSQSLSAESTTAPDTGSGDDDFFASLESELSDSLGEGKEGDYGKKDVSGEDTGDDDFFASLESSLSNDVEASQIVSEPKPSGKSKNSNDGGQDLTKLKVPDLKQMLKARGLKVSGKKSELIERLQES
jgi:transcription antitermination factor NusG